ncbi:TadE/TadG family type IV pilus assembly protein [Ideonella sp. YS5]|uniref:TadE/TadG family type IV pilus assembly protein n=1 Tax=Ideonella sp. YS5 TaxID=3453714 RepID=UPI003EEED500
MSPLHPLRMKTRHRGVAAVEFALVLPVLLALAFGASELGRAIYTYNALDKTVRDAARHLSQHGPGDTAIQAEATCLAVYGDTDCSGTPVAPGLTSSMVVLCDAVSCPSTHLSQATGAGVINLVSVSIQGYEFFSAVTYVIPDLDFNQITALMRAQL